MQSKKGKAKPSEPEQRKMPHKPEEFAEWMCMSFWAEKPRDGDYLDMRVDPDLTLWYRRRA